MSWIVVGLLIALWASVFLPGALETRRGGSPITSVHRFEASMDLLERTRARGWRPLSGPGRHVLVLDRAVDPPRPDPRARVVRRRRMALSRLAAATLTSWLAALVLGGWPWWVVAGLSTLAVGAFVLGLVRVGIREEQRRRVVRPLDARRYGESLATAPAEQEEQMQTPQAVGRAADGPS